MSDQLAAIETKIARVLAAKPQCFLTHPAELRPLRSLSDIDLREFARRRGWRAVRRIGGHQIEFYNDASLRSDKRLA